MCEEKKEKVTTGKYVIIFNDLFFTQYTENANFYQVKRNPRTFILPFDH